MTTTDSTSETSTRAADRPELSRRAAAVAALALVGVAMALAIVGLAGDLTRLIAAPTLMLLVTAFAWVAVTRRGTVRLVATIGALVVLGVATAVVLTAEGHGLGLVLVVVLLACSTALVRFALRRDARALPPRLPPPERPSPRP